MPYPLSNIENYNMLRVYITIDTECREQRIHNGVLQPEAGYDKRVFGDFNNQHSLGIPFIVASLNKYNLTGIFFVDPFGCYSFGTQGLKKTVDYLLKNNQDIQLHLHPIQKQAAWYTQKIEPVSDYMFDYALNVQSELISEAKGLLVDCGVAEHKLTSLRAGHYSANENLYQAMYENDIKFSSNYNFDYIKKGFCQLKIRQQHNISLQHSSGIVEYPITNVSTPRAVRHCQVTALSFSEMKQALDAAFKSGLQDFVIVTHSFEFLIESSNGKGYHNFINRSRFKKLCAYLAKYPDKYDVTVFSDGNVQTSAIKNEQLNTSWYNYFARVIEQGIKVIHKKLVS